MEKMKKYKIPLIVTAVIIIALCALTVVSEMTALRISDIENYEDVFSEVEKIQYYDGEDNFFTTESPEKRISSINRVKIDADPVSAEIGDDRPYSYRLVFDEIYTFYINEDFTELWADDNSADGKAPSYVYAVRNPGALKKLFD